MSNDYRVKANNLASFEVPDKSSESLLQSMEKAGMDTHFHCRNGFCGACRTRLLAGTVEYTNEPLAYVRKGDILPCVCIATSDIEIEH
ncbi:class I ribonucleotide reductase maintenance protein YfaE [Aliidiomarina sp. Khilg15.8]